MISWRCMQCRMFQLAVLLLYEAKQGAASDHHPWIQSLPSSFDTLTQWAPAELEELQLGSTIAELDFRSQVKLILSRIHERTAKPPLPIWILLQRDIHISLITAKVKYLQLGTTHYKAGPHHSERESPLFITSALSHAHELKYCRGEPSLHEWKFRPL